MSGERRAESALRQTQGWESLLVAWCWLRGGHADALEACSVGIAENGERVGSGQLAVGSGQIVKLLNCLIV